MKRANVRRMRRIGFGPEYGRGWCVWVHDDDAHIFAGAFSIHPTHEAALAHALAEVGLDRPAEHREAP